MFAFVVGILMKEKNRHFAEMDRVIAVSDKKI